MATSRRRLTLVWLALMALTCATTWGMSVHALGSVVAVVGIFGIAAAKIGFVMSEFMELRHGPWQVRAVFGTWVVAVTALILGFWFVTPAVG